MHVGRTVAGLPTESSQFSILAPHFEDHEEWRLEFVAEFCLASLVYPYTYLKATLSREHQLFETPLFQDTDLQHQLLNLAMEAMEANNLEFAQPEYPRTYHYCAK
ncbi:hypothetical protein L915_07250 [Phytophthora nicotianae]|uniref:Uncharacterized protein n=2 Tax=Phytophthora nicotianae TaxID=4792 RepID=W2GZT1_PHYNI|nr:hypothetical protein L915_07250 [Phytophthora nicotianae]